MDKYIYTYNIIPLRIRLTNEFRQRCFDIQNIIKEFNTEQDEHIEISKIIDKKYITIKNINAYSRKKPTVFVLITTQSLFLMCDEFDGKRSLHYAFDDMSLADDKLCFTSQFLYHTYKRNVTSLEVEKTISIILKKHIEKFNKIRVAEEL